MHSQRRHMETSPISPVLSQVAVITGSGQGLGAAAAELFALHGAKLVISDIDGSKAEQARPCSISVACGTEILPSERCSCWSYQPQDEAAACYHSTHMHMQVAVRIRSTGGEAHVVTGDITDESFPACLANDTAGKYGGVDILVNNAGTEA